MINIYQRNTYKYIVGFWTNIYTVYERVLKRKPTDNKKRNFGYNKIIIKKKTNLY